MCVCTCAFQGSTTTTNSEQNIACVVMTLQPLLIVHHVLEGLGTLKDRSATVSGAGKHESE